MNIFKWNTSDIVKNNKSEPLRSYHLSDATGISRGNVKDVAETAAELVDPDVSSYDKMGYYPPYDVQHYDRYHCPNVYPRQLSHYAEFGYFAIGGYLC
mmetsp:Transcript_16617/g.14100  ORF Transcript_16617/g.14100 Transcript_16617/m.14100 type:complete len:98 (+) Transcript_16617:3-296(+)